MSDTPWTVVYSRQAQKDARKLASSGLKAKTQGLLELLARDPFATPPRVAKLVGDLSGCYSRRINIQHRLVYEVLPEERVVHVLRMGSPMKSPLAKAKSAYRVAWSAEDDEFVATCREFPSLSWLAPTPDEALHGLIAVVDEVVADLPRTGERT